MLLYKTTLLARCNSNRKYLDNNADDRGFTLVELLVVLVILGLVAAIAAPRVLQYLGSSKSKAANIQIQHLVSALDLYRIDLGRYPTQEEGIEALINRPDTAGEWNGPYVRDSGGLLDPWGRRYRYLYPGERGEFEVLTFGADGKSGGVGENRDIAGW